MSKRILAVDDSATMREMIAFTLHHAGYDVTKAENGQAALDVLATSAQFDLIITDINMPQMDGYGLLERVRSSALPYSKVPVLILTTEVSQERKERGKALGATGWISKPFSPQKLTEIVAKVCG